MIDIERRHLVELEPAVIAGSRFFHQASEDPLRDPRVTLHLEDARTLLAHGAGRYDVIISEPSNPWLSGVNNLFTEDYYRLVAARLNPGGVLVDCLEQTRPHLASLRGLPLRIMNVSLRTGITGELLNLRTAHANGRFIDLQVAPSSEQVTHGIITQAA
mgnify:CR=1 FL=1